MLWMNLKVNPKPTIDFYFCEKLVLASINISDLDICGHSALEYAMQNDHEKSKIVQFLMDNGAEKPAKRRKR